MDRFSDQAKQTMCMLSLGSSFYACLVLAGASHSTLGVVLSPVQTLEFLLSLKLDHSTLHLVKVSFNLVRQLRFRPSLFPCRVSPKHFCHPLICGKGAQFEALDEEEILKFDLEIHSILALVR